MAKKPNSMMRFRLLIIGGLLGIAAFMVVVVKLFSLQVMSYQIYEEKAVEQQTRDKTIAATRGTIYDCNMKPLAISATVEMVTLEARKINSDEEAELIAQKLSELLGMDYQTVLAKTAKRDSAYEVVKRGVEKEVADQIRAFISDYNKQVAEYNKTVGKEKTKEKMNCIYLVPDTKRYYPFGNFAAHVLGFVGSDNQGLDGVEAVYDDYLTGTPGRIITATDAAGEEMPYSYEMYYEAEDGCSVVLTVDEVIQHYLEKNLEIASFDNKVANGVTGIIMDVNTGGILAMATKNDYNPNEPFKLSESEQARIAALPQDQQAEATKAARQKQWRNKAISDTYYPGSTFKILTASMALEEKTVSVNSTFYCNGSRKVEGWPSPIKCWKYPNAHGTQTLYQAIQNSCNPAFIDIGLSVGAANFLKYVRAFGLTEKTGVDLPGEASGIFHSEKKFLSQNVDLATASFGQNFSVTPLQLVTAVSAVANGGNLMKPFVVKEILDAKGNIVKSTEPTVVRQVISKDTSVLMRDILESVVTVGTGKNAYVAGYRIAGKTGTTEKIADQIQQNRNDLRVASFMAFAPADDPQIALLVLLDEPTVAVKTGGITVGPVIRRIMEDVLPYIGVEPTYNAGELTEKDVTMPAIVGKSKVEAESALAKVGLASRTVGTGATVTDQIPEAGASIPSSAQAVIYYGGHKSADLVTVPDVTGLSVSAAQAKMEKAGLYMRKSGAPGNSGNIVANKQSAAAETQVKLGSVVTVEFTDLDQRAE